MPVLLRSSSTRKWICGKGPSPRPRSNGWHSLLKAASAQDDLRAVSYSSGECLRGLTLPQAPPRSTLATDTMPAVMYLVSGRPSSSIPAFGPLLNDVRAVLSVIAMSLRVEG
eukprot:scaffold874_cov380-Prasinococcus_capsulatus_cf.AAC.28